MTDDDKRAINHLESAFRRCAELEAQNSELFHEVMVLTNDNMAMEGDLVIMRAENDELAARLHDLQIEVARLLDFIDDLDPRRKG